MINVLVMNMTNDNHFQDRNFQMMNGVHMNLKMIKFEFDIFLKKMHFIYLNLVKVTDIHMKAMKRKLMLMALKLELDKDVEQHMAVVQEYELF